jgi:ubiquinone biosynthesis protein
LAETLTEVRLLLEHEVDFRREQETIRTALGEYRGVPGVRVPVLIAELSTDTITALVEESGSKVTTAVARLPRARARVAERLGEVMVAVPAFSRAKTPIFHADPHAGNVLYDRKCDELVILDWALAERLGREHRRHLALLILMLGLRDRDGVLSAIRGLTLRGGPDHRDMVERFIASIPPGRLPGPMDAMRLLDLAARAGTRFPAPLVMFRKAAFTLDGVVEDVAGGPVRLDGVLRRYALAHWASTAASLVSLLSVKDWLALQWSALTFPPRLWVQYVAQYAEAGAGGDRAQAHDRRSGVGRLEVAYGEAPRP